MVQPELILDTTAYTIDQLLSNDIPQLALAGRSNVGKSSLINALAGRRKLAKVSSTPGKTRSVNYYRVSPWELCLVDLPGYGYAKASKSEREKWARLLEKYLSDCQSLKALVLLIDSRLEPQAIDLHLLDYAKGIGLPVLPVLTKADKCRQRDIAARQHEWTNLSGRKPVVTSSQARRGIDILWKALLSEAGIRTEEPATTEPAATDAQDK